MGCWVSTFLIIVIVVMVQNITAGAIVAFCGGLFSLFISANNKKYLSKVKNIPTVTIKDIIHTYNITKEKIGTYGHFNMMVTIEGFIKENDQLEGIELIYTDDINNMFIRENERLEGGLFHVAEYNSTNRTTRFPKIRVKNNQFYIEDDTGRILVKTDKPPVFYDNNIKILFKENKPTEDTKIVEHISGSIYIIGEASDESGKLVIQKPKDLKKPFIVSLTSKQKYFQHIETLPKRAIKAGILLTVVGTIFLLLEILK